MQLKALIKKHAEKLRFGIVGLANTAIDFVILFVLVAFGLDKIPANYISTACAFVFSYIFNRTFTFRNRDKNVIKQFILFLVVTMFGLWVIQPIVITIVSAIMAPTGWADPIILFAAKVAATVASLIWNYIFYSRFVFKKASKKKA